MTWRPGSADGGSDARESSTTWIDRFGRELRDAVRAVRRTPGTALTSAMLIALVVGGNMTIFAVVYAMLTKPARGVDADRLVTLESRQHDGMPAAHTYAEYLFYIESGRTIASLAAQQSAQFTVTLPDASYARRGSLVSPNYFDTLGVEMDRGRSFVERDNQLTEGIVAVVSHRFWQELLRARETVIGESLLLNGYAATIVGVAEPDFQGMWLGETTDVWVPIAAYARRAGTESELFGAADTLIVGQLAADVTVERAQAEYATLAEHLPRTDPDRPSSKTVGVLRYSVTAGGNSLVAKQGWRFLAMFSVVTALTVLIVCANVINLMLARALGRQREIAVRQSLGASRGSIVRAQLLEAGLIAIIAWVASCLVTVWMASAIGRLLPSGQGNVGLGFDLSPDWRVLAFGMLLALVGACAFTLPLAIRTWRVEFLPWLRAGERGITQGRSRAANALVVLQLAFAVILLTSAGLAYRSLWLVDSREVGFEQDDLLLVAVNTAAGASSPDANVMLLERMVERLRSVPSVRDASYALGSPGGLWQRVSVTTAGGADGAPVAVQMSPVGSGFLRTLGLGSVVGRDLGDEAPTAPLAAVINQNLAEALWPGVSPIGRTLRAQISHTGRTGAIEEQMVEVVGVAPNAILNGRSQRDARPRFMLLADRQRRTPPGQFALYVKHRGALAEAARDVGAALRDVDPRVAIVSMRSMVAELDGFRGPARFLTRLLAVFAAVSAAIAAFGLYAVVAFDVRRRTKDIALRMALGASARQIRLGILGEGFRRTIVGLALGSLCSLAIGYAARAALFGVTPTDATTYVTVFAMLALTTFAACYFPARRASRVTPMAVLRQD